MIKTKIILLIVTLGGCSRFHAPWGGGPQFQTLKTLDLEYQMCSLEAPLQKTPSHSIACVYTQAKARY